MKILFYYVQISLIFLCFGFLQKKTYSKFLILHNNIDRFNDDYNNIDRFNDDYNNIMKILKKYKNKNKLFEGLYNNEPYIDDTKPLYCVIGTKNIQTGELLFYMKKLNLKFYFFHKNMFSKYDLEYSFGFDSNTIVKTFVDTICIGDIEKTYKYIYKNNY